MKDSTVLNKNIMNCFYVLGQINNEDNEKVFEKLLLDSLNNKEHWKNFVNNT